jgi:hypothetical protein
VNNSYGADPQVLKQAAKGINQAIEELQGVGAVGLGAVGRGFSSLQMTQLQVGHTGLANAFATFAQRWEWEVRALVDQGNDIAVRLDLSAGYYHEAEEYAIGVVKDAVVAGYGDPAVSSEDAERMSWSEARSATKDGWTPDISQQSASEAWQQTRQAWQTTQEDLTTSGQYGTVLRTGTEIVQESVGYPTGSGDEPARTGGTGVFGAAPEDRGGA